MSDTDGDAFLELLQLQGHNELVTKNDLLEQLNLRGLSVTERQLTTYIGERLVPKSARLGRNGGLFPELAVDLVAFISVARGAQVSFGALRELLPLWQFLQRSVLCEPPEVDLAELERVVREHVRSREAAWALPWMLPGSMSGTGPGPESSLVIHVSIAYCSSAVPAQELTQRVHGLRRRLPPPDRGDGRCRQPDRTSP